MEDCLRKRMGEDREAPLVSPLRWMMKFSTGSSSTVTRKSSPPNASTVPFTAPDPETGTRATSVTLNESLPVTDIKRVAFLPVLERQLIIQWSQTNKQKSYNRWNQGGAAFCPLRPNISHVQIKIYPFSCTLLTSTIGVL